MPDLSYQEKSILGSLAALLLVYGYYFAAVLRNLDHREFVGSTLGRLIFAVVALVAIQIAYHIVLAMESGAEPKDERDVLIESKAYRNAYFALASCVWLLISALVLSVVPVTPFAIVNLVLFSMVAAEIVHYLTQLFYYRQGVR